MYTANIIEKSLFNGELKVTVRFSDGTQTFSESYSVSSLDDLNRKIKNNLKRLELLEADASKITNGAFTPTEDVPVVQTQVEKDKQDWFRDFGRLENLERLNKLGALRPALVTDLEALRIKVADNFKKAYIADM